MDWFLAIFKCFEGIFLNKVEQHKRNAEIDTRKGLFLKVSYVVFLSVFNSCIR